MRRGGRFFPNPSFLWLWPAGRAGRSVNWGGGSPERHRGEPARHRWLLDGGGSNADPSRFAAAVRNSLDRKVCNTLNVCAIVRSRSEELAPVFLDALTSAAERRGVNPKLWVTEGDEGLLPDHWFRSGAVTRAEGEVTEPITDTLPHDHLGIEWEWEESPEVTLTVVDSVEQAVELFNTHSPKLVASLIDDDPAAQERFYGTVDSPFVGNGFTRWVDGQFALAVPNWDSPTGSRAGSSGGEQSSRGIRFSRSAPG